MESDTVYKPGYNSSTSTSSSNSRGGSFLPGLDGQQPPQNRASNSSFFTTRESSTQSNGGFIDGGYMASQSSFGSAGTGSSSTASFPPPLRIQQPGSQFSGQYSSVGSQQFGGFNSTSFARSSASQCSQASQGSQISQMTQSPNVSMSGPVLGAVPGTSSSGEFDAGLTAARLPQMQAPPQIRKTYSAPNQQRPMQSPQDQSSFRNPWSSTSSSSSGGSRSGSGSQEIGVFQPTNLQSPQQQPQSPSQLQLQLQSQSQSQSQSQPPQFRASRKSFTSSLSTTFEDMELEPQMFQQQGALRRQSIVPPSRIDGPQPTDDPNAPFHPQRRQSVATGSLQQQQQQIQKQRQQLKQIQQQRQIQQQQRQQPQIIGGFQMGSTVPTVPAAAARAESATISDKVEVPPSAPLSAPLPAPTFHPVHSRVDLNPKVNEHPQFRRADGPANFVSPVKALTTSLTTTYQMCVPKFDYKTSKNPRRVLTKPSQPKTNSGFDNEQSDYILYVNDILGIQENRKYMVVDILGHGTFGQVVKCQDLDTQELVAVKVIRSRQVYLNQSLTEARLLEYLNTKVDPNDEHHLLRMKDRFMHKGHLCLVLELLSSNLYELIRQNQFHGLTLKLIRKFAVQLLDTLCIMKEAELIHCDLKPENVLLVSLDKPDVKVIDFGSACHEKQAAYTYIQSRFYRSPEVILGLSYSAAVDMWSFGCIIAELFLGLPLFPGSSEFNQLTRIVRMLGMPPSWMAEMGKNSKNFLNRMSDVSQGKPYYYELKSPQQYAREFHIKDVPEKKYFKDRYLGDIIMNYRMPRRNMTHQMVEKEMEGRRCLTHFLTGILNLNPLERWTPQEAAMHPFVTGQPFEGDWNPPTKVWENQMYN